MRVQSLGGEDPLEKEMATHSSILTWRIPWTEEAGGLQAKCWIQWSTALLCWHSHENKSWEDCLLTCSFGLGF